MRRKRVHVYVQNLKPNTRVYPFFDGIDVSTYCTESNKINGFPKSPESLPSFYNTLAQFGTPLITDKNGRIRFFFYLPAETAGLKFRSGARKFRVCDSKNNDNTSTTLAETDYFSLGLIQVPGLRTPSIRQPKRSNKVTFKAVGTIIEPIAQTFTTSREVGSYLKKIDVYFRTKDIDVPITLDVRPVINGQPSDDILGYSTKTLYPDEINVSENGSAVTSFEFENPVFINEGNEYCFILTTNSTKYSMWVATTTQADRDTNAAVTPQANVGTVYRTNLQDKWVQDSKTLFKFVIHDCLFTQTSGTAVFKNGNLPSDYAGIAALLDNTGESQFSSHYLIEDVDGSQITTTTASNVVNVNQTDHGYITGDTGIIHIAGADTTLYNGIPLSEYVGAKTVTVVDIDNYTYTTTTNATSTGSIGNIAAYATKNIPFNTMQINANAIVLPETSVDWRIATTFGRSISDDATLGPNQSVYLETNGTTNPEVDIVPNKNLDYSLPRIITPAHNAIVRGLSTTFSMTLSADLATDKTHLSPLVDLTGLNALGVSNRINYILSTDSGKVYDTGSKGTSSTAKYITKSIALAAPSTGLRVLFAANRPDFSDVEAYYRVSSGGRLDDLSWVKFPDSNKVYPGPSQDPSEFKDYQFSVDNGTDGVTLGAFTVYAIKLVLKSRNTSAIPRLKDFRVIALAT